MQEIFCSIFYSPWFIYDLPTFFCFTLIGLISFFELNFLVQYLITPKSCILNKEDLIFGRTLTLIILSCYIYGSASIVITIHLAQSQYLAFEIYEIIVCNIFPLLIWWFLAYISYKLYKYIKFKFSSDYKSLSLQYDSKKFLLRLFDDFKKFLPSSLISYSVFLCIFLCPLLIRDGRDIKLDLMLYSILFLPSIYGAVYINIPKSRIKNLIHLIFGRIFLAIIIVFLLWILYMRIYEEVDFIPPEGLIIVFMIAALLIWLILYIMCLVIYKSVLWLSSRK